MTSKGPVMVYTGGGARAATEAHLWVCSGKNIGRRFALDKPDMVVGRSSTADIPVVDERVSQQHALISPHGDGHTLRDLGSTNGTFVNNQRVHESVLRDGDLIQVGETVFEYLSYQERNLTITLRGTNKDSDAVPAALRDEARQMLEQARVHPQAPVEDPVSHIPSTQPGTGPTMDVPAMDPAATGPAAGIPSMMPHLQRPARDIGRTHHPHAGAPGAYPPPHNPNLPAAYMGVYPPQSSMVPHGHSAAPMAAPYPEERAAVLVDDNEDEGGGGFDVEMVFARLRDVQSIFGPYWKSIILLIALGTGAGVYMFDMNPPMQTAEFEIALQPQTQKNPLQPYYGRLQRFFLGAEQAFTSPNLIEKTLTELGQENPDPATLDRVASSLTLVSAGPPTPDTYTGSYRHNDGDWALSFLETHVRLYLESEVEKALKVLKAEGAFLQEQVEEMEKQLRRTEAEVMEFKKKNLESTQGNNGAYGRLVKLRLDESEAIMDLAKARKTRRMLQQRLRTEQPLIKTKQNFTNPFKASIASLELQLIKEKSSGKGPDHPDVVQLEKNLRELRVKAEEAKDDPTSFTTARNPVHTRIQNEERNLEIQEQLAEQQLAYVRREIKKTEALVARLPELEAEKAELMRSYKTINEQYDKLLQQLQVVQVQLNLERASVAARYDVISEPHLVYQPRGKKMAMYAIFGAAFGFGLGMVLALLRWARKTGKLAALIALLKKKSKAPEPTNEKALVAAAPERSTDLQPPPR